MDWCKFSSGRSKEFGCYLLQTMQQAICPERSRGTAVSAIASVTEVRLTSDLQVAKVYVSVFS